MREDIIRGKRRTEVYIPNAVKVKYRKDEEVPREQTIVFDYMPSIVGDQFRVNPVLKVQLFRVPPVNAPFMLTNTAYTVSGQRALEKGDLTAALESYKIALDASTKFTKAISRLQDAALLNDEEKSHLRLMNHPLGDLLVKKLSDEGVRVDEATYSQWIDELRNMDARWLHLNKMEYGFDNYIELSWKLGRFSEAIHNARDNNKYALAKQIEKSVPKEVLDVPFLKKYIEDNFPKSSMG